MRFDRKLLLIAPTIVLFLIVGGLLYAALQLDRTVATPESIKNRGTFVGAVERGERTLTPAQSAGLLRLGLQVEEKRTAAITASRDLLVALAAMTFAACCVLVLAIRKIPREHWPRFTFGSGAKDD